MNPVLSIIIPCYNVENYIEKCIDSIINCNFNLAYEIITINDGSQDKTLEKLNFLVKKYSNENIVIYDQKNQGISEARNQGIKLSKGEYIIFIDSDDWVSDNYLDILYNKILTGYDCVFVSYFKAYKTKNIKRIFNLQGKYKANQIMSNLIGLSNKQLSDPSQIDSLVTIWGKIYKSEIIKDNNLKFLDTKLIGTGEDLIFNLNYFKYSTDVFIINEPHYFYRKTITSFTNNYKINLLKTTKLRLDIVKRNVNSKNINEFNNRVALTLISLGLNEINNPKGLFYQIENVKLILNDSLYKNSLKNLEIKYMPLHWKIFFLSAKYNFSAILVLLLNLIRLKIK